MGISNTSNSNNPVQSNYDARWFVWTIVFLVVTGISLVSYIVFSDTTEVDVPIFTNANAAKKK